jgi:hypothetical protein
MTASFQLLPNSESPNHLILHNLCSCQSVIKYVLWSTELFIIHLVEGVTCEEEEERNFYIFILLYLYLLNKPDRLLKEVLQQCGEKQLPE